MSRVPDPLLARLSDTATPLAEAYEICAAQIPNGLFTAMRFHEAAMEVERLYSTLPDDYPVSGRKPKRQTEWGDKVLIRREVNAGFGEDDIAWAFSDHALIGSLGLRAVLNVPVTNGDRTLGTINYLRSGPQFDADEIETGRALAAALGRRGALI